MRWMILWEWRSLWPMFAGHGIQADIFMEIVRSCIRTALLGSGPLASLLGDICRVVFEIETAPRAVRTVAFPVSSMWCERQGRVFSRRHRTDP